MRGSGFSLSNDAEPAKAEARGSSLFIPSSLFLDALQRYHLWNWWRHGVTDRNSYRVFFHWYPPKKLKYGKPRLGESTLTQIGQDTPNLAQINFLYLELLGGGPVKKKTPFRWTEATGTSNEDPLSIVISSIISVSLTLLVFMFVARR